MKPFIQRLKTSNGTVSMALVLSLLLVQPVFGQINVTNGEILLKDCYILVDAQIVDFDNDGDWDIVQHTEVCPKTEWLENHGDGDFGPPQYLIDSDFEENDRLVIGEITGDDLPDIVFADSSEDEIVFFENEGNGIMGERQKLFDFDFNGIIQLTVDDFNDDGLDDVLIGKVQNFYYFQNNQGDFSETPFTLATIDDGKIAAVQDVDSDGFLDIIRYEDNNIALFRNNQAGGFLNVEIISNEPNDDYETAMLRMGDIDNDGCLDVVVLGPTGFNWLEGNCTGAFEEPKTLANLNDVLSYSLIDYNSDGWLDVVYEQQGGFNREHFGVVQSLGQGTFDTPITKLENVRGFVSFAGNLDADPFVELIIQADSGLGIVHIDEDESFGEEEAIWWRTGRGGQVFTADLNNNGRKDIFLNNSLVNEIHLSNEDGVHTFTSAKPTLEGQSREMFEDIDGDGFLDYIYSTRVNDTIPQICWQTNMGNGFLESASCVLSSISIFSPTQVFEDYNSDGHLDLMAIQPNNLEGYYDAELFLNDGLGGFEDASLIELDEYNLSFLKAKVGDDIEKGILQFTVSGLFRSSYVAESNSFEQGEQLIAFEHQLGLFKLVELNQDDRVDLITLEVSPTQRILSVYYGNDNGFTSPQTLHETFDLIEIEAVLDLNGDGTLDIQVDDELVLLNIKNRLFFDREFYTSGFGNSIIYEDIVDDHLPDGRFVDHNGQMSSFQLDEYIPNMKIEFEGCGLYNFYNLSYPLWNYTDLHWDFGDGTTSSDIHVFEKTFANAGMHEISLRICNDFGCDTLVQEIDVTGAPSFDIPAFAEVGQPIEMSHNSFGYTNQSWIIDGDIVYLESSLSHTFDTVGTHTVELVLTNANIVGCTVNILKEIEVVDPTSIETIESDFQITIGNNEVRVIPNDNQSLKEISLYNVSGKFHSRKVAQGAVSFTNLTPGVYILSGQFENGQVLGQKIVVPR